MVIAEWSRVKARHLCIIVSPLDLTQVTMFYKSKQKSYIMTPKRKQLCRPLARGSRCSFARKCLKDKSICKYIIKGMGASLRHEIARLCSDDTSFILHAKTSSSLKEFQWEKLLTEAKELAPTLIQILYSCTKTKTPRKNQNDIIGVLLAIMCKHRRPVSSLFQRLVSLILYAGHSSKRVSMVASYDVKKTAFFLYY